MFMGNGAERSKLLDTYLHYRKVQKAYGSVLMRRLPREALARGGRHLGLMHRGVFVFDNEQEAAILMDYCFHSIRSEGRNVVQRYLDESPPAPGSDDLMLLQALAKARFSIYRVLQVERGLGVEIGNVFADEELFQIDVNTSNNAVAGTVFAGRMVKLPDFSMGTGAAVPIHSRETLRDIGRALDEEFRGGFNWMSLTPKQQTVFETIVLGACLKAGESSRARYEDAEEGLALSDPISRR